MKTPLGRADNPPSHFKQLIAQEFYARLHMTLILGAVAISGVLLSKLLLELGVRSILARYVTAVVASYSLFFLFIRIWLWYVSPATDPDGHSRGRGEIDLFDDFRLDFASSSGGDRTTGGDFPTNTGFTGFGGAGDFGGRGATDEWGNRVIVSPAAADSSPARASSSNTSTSSSIDGGEIIVLIVFGILLVVIFGAGAYLVYQAPVILSEAAFEALLASGLVKASNKMHRVGWMGSVFKATRIPFIVLLVMTVVFGLVVSQYCPEATRLADIFGDCGRT